MLMCSTFWRLFACPVLVAVAAAGLEASEATWHLVDAPHESPAHLGAVAGNGVVMTAPEAMDLDAMDFVDRQVGDFSLRGVVGDGAASVGLTPGPFIPAWDLSGYERLRLWFRVGGDSVEASVALVLVDAADRRARHADLRAQADGNWHHLDVPLAAFDRDRGFRLDGVVAIQTAGALPPRAEYGFDGAHFAADDLKRPPLGITDMTYAQRMSEAEATREARARVMYRQIADNDNPPSMLMNEYAKLWLGEDLDEVNDRLLTIFSADRDSELGRQHELHRDWSLWLSPYLVRLYDQFGSTSKKMPGRLYPETEKALLELLWARTQATNDITLARKSTWWMIGSENHDAHIKADALLSSQIFKNHPDFANRVYPNAGTGGGKGYWFHHNHGEGAWKGPHGNADWSDGKDYTPQDHYDAWVAYWKEYLRERVKKGFFLEVASQGYMKFTVTSILDIYSKVEDEELRQLAGQFLDLVWAEWAQDQLVAVRGGSKTRWYDRPFGAMYEASAFLSGGTNTDRLWWYPLYASDYRWPEHVWRMALDRRGKGDYAFISRIPGEEPLMMPRPAGLERTLMCDTESRFVRYSWVTPDYILGTQMDHPNAIHSHLSSQNRWQGMTFSASATSTVAPCGIEIDEVNGRWQQASRRNAAYFRSLQDGNVLITQQARRWHQQNPDWYPAKDMHVDHFGVRFKNHRDFDAVDEQGGWIFARVGNAYVGIRPVKGDYEYDENWTSAGETDLYARMDEHTYDWGPNREFIRFVDRFSPVIVHAGRAETHGDFEAFKRQILAGQVRLQNTVVPGWYILVYEPTGETPRRFEFNAANTAIPMVNGELVDYAPDQVFSSPFLNARYNSGVVHYTVDGLEHTVDFRSVPQHRRAER